MKNKVLYSLAGFVVLCVAIGIISIIKKPITSADTHAPHSAETDSLASLWSNTGPEATDLSDSISSGQPSDIDYEEDFPIAKKEAVENTGNISKTTMPKPEQIPTSKTVSEPKTYQIPVQPPTIAKDIVVKDIKWGAYLSTGGVNAVSIFESLVGASMDIRAVFVGWGDKGQFPTWFSDPLAGSGKTLLIYWEPSDGNPGNVNQPNYNYDSIVSGRWDNYITSFASAAKKYGGHIILAPFEEMNGDWYPWAGTLNGNTPAKMIAAWRHMHDLFTAQGADNVEWGWAPNADSWPQTEANDLTKYYPGSDYVDIVGVDGFNFNRTNNPWQSFSEVMDSGLSKVKQYNKPIYIFSMASAEKGDGGVSKSEWIRDALLKQIPDRNIAGWIWFNEDKEENWLVNSSPSSLSAFSNAVRQY